MDNICAPFGWRLGWRPSTSGLENHPQFHQEQQHTRPSTSEEAAQPSVTIEHNHHEWQSANEVEVLYSPNGTEREMEIIFFPGLRDFQSREPSTKTWVASKNERLIWPKEWLSKVFPKARILFVSCAIENKLLAYMGEARGANELKRLQYEGNLKAIMHEALGEGRQKRLLQEPHLLAFLQEALGENKLNELKNEPRQRLAFIVEALVQEIFGSSPHLLAFMGEALVLKLFGSSSIGQKCPVFLVGHSLGGIVIKHFIQSCKNLQRKSKPIDNFLENLRGVFYYATPHEDSNVRHFANRIGMRPLIRNIPFDDNYWISEDYRKVNNGEFRTLRTFAVLEGLPPKGYNTTVVGESSARSEVDDFYIHTAADHLTVCEARDENDPVVIGKLTQFIVNGMPTATVEPRQKEERRLNDSTVVHVLNDSVWEFSSPSDPEMDIIFFHGLQPGDYKNAVWNTWWAKDKTVDIIWPKEWLTKVFPRARMLSISYNSSATNSTGQIDMYNLGRSLVSNIIDDVNYNIGQNCPVFLVGHSLGGIVIKQFILAAIAKKNSLYLNTYKTEIDKIEQFLQNLKGVFYYATPHGGSSLADFVTRFPILKWKATPTVALLTTLYAHRGRINEEFRQQRANLSVRSCAMAEGLPTQLSNVLPFLKFVVVNEGSARHDVDEFFTHTTGNHYTVCKATDMNDPLVIGKLTQFITNAMPSNPTVKGVPQVGGFSGYVRVSNWSEPRSSFKDKKCVRQLNSSVWEVFSPEKPEMDIIFFHGFQPDDFENAFWKTWEARDDGGDNKDENQGLGKAIVKWVSAFWKTSVASEKGGENQGLLWPKEWLPIWVPKARILLVSYYSSAKVVATQNDMYALGEILVGNIILDANCNAGQNCPVFLVGHSVGGIVIKQFILSAIVKKNLLHRVQYKREIDRIEKFLQNFKGVSYYATPHGGSDVAKYASRLLYACPVVGVLEKLDIERQRINEEFRQQRRILKARALAQAETEEFKFKRWSGVIVDEKSARQDFDEFEKCQGSNHFDICKARNMDDWDVIGRLTQFITDTMPKGKLITVIKRPRVGFSRYQACVSSQADADAGEDDKYIVQLNDSVWELYSPRDTKPEMDIVFFSGPDESVTTFWKTWITIDDDEVVWPKEWLPRWFPRARVLLIIPDAVETLVDNIILNGNCNAGQKCPVFLVGPNVGGIILHLNFLLSANSKKTSLNPELDEFHRIETFLGHVAGVHSYYATPHLGPDVGEKLEDGVGRKARILTAPVKPRRNTSPSSSHSFEDRSSDQTWQPLKAIQQLDVETWFCKDLRELQRISDVGARAITGERLLPMTIERSAGRNVLSYSPRNQAREFAGDWPKRIKVHEIIGRCLVQGWSDTSVPVELEWGAVASNYIHNQASSLRVSSKGSRNDHELIGRVYESIVTSHLTSCRARSIDDYEVIGRLAEAIVNTVPAGRVTCTPPDGFALKFLNGGTLLQ